MTSKYGPGATPGPFSRNREHAGHVVKRIPLLATLWIPLSSLAAPLALAGDLAAGKATAEAKCQTCHGIDGKATIPMAANLGGQQKDYLVAQLQAYRSGKRRHEQMSIVTKTLKDADIDNLAEWYSSIKVTLELPK
jgi:cytochrome c553